ncbi:MAG: TonB-dependent receptor [Chitinophagaceae bacterium]
MKNITLLLALFCIVETAKAQTVKGILTDENEKTPLIGATVKLINRPDSLSKDSSVAYTTLTNKDGAFIFENVAPKFYHLSVSSIGLGAFKMTINVKDTTVSDLGTIPISKSAKILDEVTITSAAPPVKQKTDTVEYSANQFKVNPDATVEDLIKKMPGVTVDRSGTVTAQGEQVRKVTVDGKEFFGDDATAALRNLPAEIIDKIQVFDRLSDQSQFTGFDDGNSQKAINVVTKANMRNGQFGRMYAGYGTDDRYSAGGNVSFFKGNRRVSLVGIANNINQQNFSSQDLLGVTSSGGNNRGGGNRGGPQQQRGNRGGGGNFGDGNQGNFLVGQQNGISKTNAFGINYSDQWGKLLTVTGSYFFNNSNNSNNQTTFRQPANNNNSIPFYTENSTSSSQNYNNRINLRLEYKIDSFNSLIITPTLNFQKNTSNNNYSALTSFNNIDPVSSSDSRNSRFTTGYNFNNNILYRHSFTKRGRTISLGFNTSANKRDGDTYQESINRYFDKQSTLTKLDSILQFTDNVTNGYTLSPNIAYTEPVGKQGQLQLNYNLSFTKNKADQQTFQFDQIGKKYSLFDTSLSNKFDNTYNTQNAGVSYQVGNRDQQFSVGLNYQHSKLFSDQTFPQLTSVNKTFSNILPNLRLRKKLSAKSSINAFLRTSVNAPSVNQLQNVLNRDNPLLQSIGNPDLKQQYSGFFVTRYTYTNTLKGKSFFANAFFQKIDDYITNAVFIASRDSLITKSDTLKRGSQLIKPTNIDGYFSVRSFLTYGMPLKFIKSTFNVNAGFNYNKLPGLINNKKTITTTNTYSGGAVIASNINEYVDFNLSYSGNYNAIAERPEDNYYTSNAGVQVNLLGKSGWFLQNDLNNQTYQYKNNIVPDQNFWLWNASAGKKFLKDQAGELKLSVFDLLKQNKSISRTVTETYIEDIQSQVLQRYFMLTFTYKLKNFGTAAARSLNKMNRKREQNPGF